MLPPLKIRFGTFRQADVPNVGYGALAKAGVWNANAEREDSTTDMSANRAEFSGRERRSLFDEGIENIMSYQTGVTRPNTAREDEA